MLNLLNAVDNCGGIGPIVKFIKSGIFPIIQIGIPIILIIMGSLDLGKAVLSNDEKEIKGATSKLIKRAIAAVAVFFVVMFVTVLMNLIATSSAEDANTTSWATCWKDPLGDKNKKPTIQ